MSKEKLNQVIGWEIEKKNVFSGDIIGLERIEKYNAITRNDNGNVLSVMKNTYSPMTNTEFMGVVENIKRISGFELAGFNEYKGGRKVIGFLENNLDDLYIGGHKMRNYMLLGNSFDGTTSFFIGTSTILIRCENQFSQIQELTKIRHTKKIQSKLDEYYLYLDSFFAQRETIKRTFEKAVNFKMSEELQEKMINFVLDVPEVSDKEISERKQKQIELLRNSILTESLELGDNLWGAFNGVTKYTTHEVETKVPIFGNLYGIKADVNDRAFKFVTEELARS